MKNLSILISGASIAGPALAYWLTRYGFSVTVVERAPGLREGGYGVDLRGAALKVVERMGILDKVKTADTEITSIDFVNYKGKKVARMNEAAIGNEPGVDIEVMRDDLSHILYNLTKDTAEYIWDDSITGLIQSEANVKVDFKKASSRTFDLVIGADGLHSNVRNLVFGDEAQFSNSLGCYIAIFTLDNYLNLDHSELIYNVPGKTVFTYSARHNKEAKVFFMFKSPQIPYEHYDVAAQKKILKDAFIDEKGWEVQRLLKAMANAPDFYFDSVSQIHMDTWAKGRVALVGDAAYGPSPASGQGTSLAIVGAYILAGELHNTSGDYAKAFANYKEEMRIFAQKNQKFGQIVAKMLVDSSKAKPWMINLMLHVPGLMRFVSKRVTGKVKKAANAIKLKDYDLPD